MSSTILPLYGFQFFPPSKKADQDEANIFVQQALVKEKPMIHTHKEEYGGGKGMEFGDEAEDGGCGCEKGRGK